MRANKLDRAIGEVPVLWRLHGLPESCLWVVKRHAEADKLRVMPYEFGSPQEFVFLRSEVEQAQANGAPLQIPTREVQS